MIGADLFEDAEEGVLVLHGAGGFGRDFDVEGSFRDRRLEALPRIPEPRRAGDEAEGVIGDDLERRLARGAAKEDRASGDAGGFVNADDAGQVVDAGEDRLLHDAGQLSKDLAVQLVLEGGAAQGAGSQGLSTSPTPKPPGVPRSRDSPVASLISA